jgi:hypothetical protein
MTTIGTTDARTAAVPHESASLANGLLLPNGNAILDDARRYLDIIGQGATRFTFQTFDDNKKRKAPSLARKFHGTLDKHAAKLIDLHQRGAGVFVTVNETDLKGRKKRNMVRPRVGFIEADDGLPDNLPLPPSMVIKTSPGRFHLIWSVTDLSWEQFDAIMRLMIAEYGSDPDAKDWTRVLRLPGFYHQKAEPWLVHIVEDQTTGVVYEAEEFLAAFPPAAALQKAVKAKAKAEPKPSANKEHSVAPKSKVIRPWRREREVWNGTEQQRNKLISALQAIQDKLTANGPFTIAEEGNDPMLIDWRDRTFWFLMGASIHQFFEGAQQGYEIWAAASRTGAPEKFNEADQQKTWDSLIVPVRIADQYDGLRTVRTIFWIAYRYCGWTCRGQPYKRPTIRRPSETIAPVAAAGQAAVAMGIDNFLKDHNEATLARHKKQSVTYKLIEALTEELDRKTGTGAIISMAAIGTRIGCTSGTVEETIRRATKAGLLVKANGQQASFGLGTAYALAIPGQSRLMAPIPTNCLDCSLTTSAVAACSSNTASTHPIQPNGAISLEDELTLRCLDTADYTDIEPWIGLMPKAMVDLIRAAQAKRQAMRNIGYVAGLFRALRRLAKWQPDDYRHRLPGVHYKAERLAEGRIRKKQGLEPHECLEKDLTPSQYLASLVGAVRYVLIDYGVDVPVDPSMTAGSRKYWQGQLLARKAELEAQKAAADDADYQVRYRTASRGS